MTESVSTANGADRVMRGGNWSSDKAADLRAANRGWVDPKEAFEFAGFRCAGAPLR